MSHTLLSSPLQGFTDYRFRNALNRHFGGIDTYYSPYIRLNGKLEIKPAYQRDILPENNRDLEVIPQIMTNDADEFLFVSKYVQSLGYKELNWNLGCPYPMVTNRCMGSGLIADAQRIDRILERVHAESDIIVSMKMRMGYENPTEILDVFPLLEKYPIKNIAIHARIGKQLYKGDVDLDSFEKCLNNTSHKIYYNGDITSVAAYQELVERFPTIDHWMMGRGLISDPFLPSKIKSNSNELPVNKYQIFRAFHDELYDEFSAALSGSTNILTKMHSYWEYFETIFPDIKKPLKKIKKARTVEVYLDAVDEILETEMVSE
ncbi:MAG: tRNA-dihydrouridine synthase family protein [Crocinitomicaceae bacterium]